MPCETHKDVTEWRFSGWLLRFATLDLYSRTCDSEETSDSSTLGNLFPLMLETDHNFDTFRQSKLDNIGVVGFSAKKY